jgi:hypothetical protein
LSIENSKFASRGQERSEVYAAELEHLKRRRESAGTGSQLLSGIAFSGGGIRSACFSLGVMGWLERTGTWKNFDYVSSVSGGGYAVASILGREDEFDRSGVTRAEKVIEKIRSDEGYLKSLAWTVLFFVCSLVLSAILVFSPILLLCSQTAAIIVGSTGTAASDAMTGAICLFLLIVALYTRKKTSMVSSIAFTLAVVFFVTQVGWAIGHEYTFLQSTMIVLVSISWFLVVIVLSLRPGRPIVKRAQRLSLFFILANLLLSFALAIQWVTKDGSTRFTDEVLAGTYTMAFLLFLAALVSSPNRLNPLSHRYFSSLRDAFGDGSNEPIWRSSSQSDSPIHLINCFVQSPGTRDVSRVQKWGGENFCVSSLFCGSDTIGYFETSDWSSGKRKSNWRHQEIWRLISTSGAAVDAHPVRQSPLQNALHAAFNAGLGAWVINPAFNHEHRTHWPSYLLNFAAVLGGHSTSQKWIRLSDGGHFENLGLYELVARKCMDIVVIDAGYDPEYRYEDLAAAVEKCREDFEVEIEFPDLYPQGDRKEAFARLDGSVRYPNLEKPGKITYLKLAVTKHHSTRMRLASALDRQFPHEPTFNQLSTTAFVDSYYQLGYETAEQAFPGGHLSSDDSLPGLT